MEVKLGEEYEKKMSFGVDLFANEKKKEGRKETNCKENLKETEKGYSELRYWLQWLLV